MALRYISPEVRNLAIPIAEEITMPERRVIKRYANRKLYDTQHSRYVTLDQIAEMIRDGDDVQIIDNKTKTDLTSVTLAQIIFEEEKKQKSFISMNTMRTIIQNGGESLTHLVSEAGRRVTSILPHKRVDDTLEPGDQVNNEVQATDTYAGSPRRGTIVELREWINKTQRAIEDLQKKVDSGIRMAVGSLPFGGLTPEVDALKQKINELEKQLEQFADSQSDLSNIPSNTPSNIQSNTKE